MTASNTTSSEEHDSDGGGTEAVGAKVPVFLKEKVQREALERSEPGERVNESDVLRDALAEYYDLDRTEVSLEE
jgi:hypothetical protein